MCDYSLHAYSPAPPRLAKRSYRQVSHGLDLRLCPTGYREIAVCLLPGRSWRSKRNVKFYHRWIWAKKTGFRVARFCQIDMHLSDRHHDALELPDGKAGAWCTAAHPGQRHRALSFSVRELERIMVAIGEMHVDLAKARHPKPVFLAQNHR